MFILLAISFNGCTEYAGSFTGPEPEYPDIRHNATELQEGTACNIQI